MLQTCLKLTPALMMVCANTQTHNSKAASDSTRRKHSSSNGCPYVTRDAERQTDGENKKHRQKHTPRCSGHK